MNQRVLEKMQETKDAEIAALRREYEQRYDDLRRRIDGMWWKIGVMAGVISVLIAEVFGSGASSIITYLTGVI